MVRKFMVDQGFRVYSIALLVVAGFTGAWSLGAVDAAPLTLGVLWAGVAALGGIAAVVMALRKDRAVADDMSRERRRTFETNPLTGTPLNVYLAGLAGWAAVTLAWLAAGLGTGFATVVGYGWVAVAAYGGVLTLGLVVTHSETVITAVSPASSLDS
jgi:hypothetical protein